MCVSCTVYASDTADEEQRVKLRMSAGDEKETDTEEDLLTICNGEENLVTLLCYATASAV